MLRLQKWNHPVLCVVWSRSHGLFYCFFSWAAGVSSVPTVIVSIAS
ncbi:hypothetical protein HMPREF3213_00091 [Heyndrickxia coagulans]|uniref:Uncharacterized protein n=1 Tax=Heyndrickxia coagulans TaxID=1398 RepID=A0A133L4Q1_HEYCO|nr:hypothetical protein HMPREF3213_00091 [Heyndrickxia coagulans]